MSESSGSMSSNNAYLESSSCDVRAHWLFELVQALCTDLLADC